jgi:hypothetical protein
MAADRWKRGAGQNSIIEGRRKRIGWIYIIMTKRARERENGGGGDKINKLLQDTHDTTERYK